MSTQHNSTCRTCKSPLSNERARFCADCLRKANLARLKAWRDGNKERRAEYILAWRKRNSDHVRSYAITYRDGNEAYSAKKKETAKRYYEQVVKTDAEAVLRRAEYGKEWASANPEKVQAKLKRYRDKNPELLRQRSRQHYAFNLDQYAAYRKANAERYKKWRDDHKQELAEYARKHWAKNQERNKAYARKHYEENKLEYILRANKRRILLVGDYTPSDIEAMYDAQCGICAGCLKELHGKYEIDHIMPLALDPTGDRLENLQLLCMPCNRRKHAKHPDEWALIVEKIRSAA